MLKWLLYVIFQVQEVILDALYDFFQAIKVPHMKKLC